MFQYKIIHIYLPTQMSLYRDGISESDICQLCKSQKQTLNHLFVLRSETNAFWNTFQSWWFEKTQEKIYLNQSKILCGFFDKSSHWQALNHLILIAKHHIFCTNGRQDEPACFQSFLLRMQEKIQILKESATARNNLQTFNRT